MRHLGQAGGLLIAFALALAYGDRPYGLVIGFLLGLGLSICGRLIGIAAERR